eukprot:4389861-Ditylum_brightwellii.AAC.1
MNNADVDVGTEDDWEDDWEDERIFNSFTEHNDEDVWNDDVKSVFEEDWEDEGILMTSREQIDLWNDNETVIVKSQVMLVMVGEGQQ